MPIQNMPSALQPAIQQGFLEREFTTGLQSAIGYRDIADREPIAIGVGETITKTRAGLKAPVTTALIPSANTNLDNGITPSSQTVEQYTLPMNQYGDSIDLNVVTSTVGIANQFLLNARTNGIQARQSLDRMARNALFSAYLGGNTRVRVTLGAPAATIQVDNVLGFETMLATSGTVQGTVQTVSATYTASVTVGSNVYTLIGTSRDGTNVSTTPLGYSGTLTFSANVTVADATALNGVAHANGPVLVRPNGKWFGGSAASALTCTTALTSSDVLTLGTVEDSIANLRNNTGIQDELFNLYLDNVSMRQLFADPDFKQMYQGQYGSKESRMGRVFELMGARFIPTTETLVQTLGNIKVRRPILCAPGALVEGDFAGMSDKAFEITDGNSEIQMVDDVVQVIRGPIDRLQQIIAQSWFWMGGFCAPTDVTANSNIIPTAGNQYLKRSIVIEHAS